MPSTTSTQTALLLLSILISLPLFSISSHILSSFNSQHSNPWWIPIWRSHFRTSGLTSVITSSVLIFLFDIIALIIIFKKNKSGPQTQASRGKRFVITGLMFAAMIAALVATIMSAVANSRSPRTSDTMQTWTCRWRGTHGAPEEFEGLCRESVFSSYTPIPLFILHIVLLAQTIQDTFTSTKPQSYDFDEELVRITKSVDVVTQGSGSGSPDLEKGSAEVKSVEVRSVEKGSVDMAK